MGQQESPVQVLAAALRRLVRMGAVDLGASMLVVLALGFAQNLVLARILGPGGIGHMAVVYSTVTVASLLGTAGLTSSILRYGAAAPSPAHAWSVFRRSAGVCLAISLAMVLVTIGFARSPLWVFDPVAGSWMGLVAFTLPAQALGSCAVHYLQARDRMREKALVDSFSRFVTVAAVLTGGFLRGFDGAVWGYIAGATAGGVIALAVVLPGRSHEAVAPHVSTRELLRFGSWALLTNALGLGLVTADIFCVSALVQDSAQVGLYFLAVQLQQIVAIPMRAYLDARFPEMTRLSADPPALRRLWRRMRWQLVAVAALGSVALMLAAPLLLPIVFGAAFAASALPLSILLAGQIGWSAGAAAGRSLFAAGFVEANFWLSSFTAVTTIAANLALIPLLGIAGAAVATSATNLAWAALVTVVCRWYETYRAPV
jgi:O-antigen/teichoic acid export membrane protein